MKAMIVAFFIGWVVRGYAGLLFRVIRKAVEKAKSKETTVALTEEEYSVLMRLMEKEKARAKTFGFSRALMEDKANDEDGAA